MIWFLDNPARSKQERLQLELLVGSVDWLVPIGWRMETSHLSWDADILIGDQVRPITLRYPNHFPFSPPRVVPREDQPSWWSSHQYGVGGELCLEYGPDNWHSNLTGADMIRSAHRLLVGEAQIEIGGPELPSRHRMTFAERLRGKNRRFYFDLEAQFLLIGLTEEQVIKATTLTVIQAPGATRHLASAEVGPCGWNAALPEPLFRHGFTSPTALIRWPANENLPSTESAASFRAELASRDMDIGDACYLVIIREEFISAFDVDREDDCVREISVIFETEQRGRLDPSHDVLKNQKVAIIGCGSIGSKVALILARSDIRQFVLVDNDIFLRENLVRNDLDWRDVGSDKVDAIAARVKLVNAKAVCVKHKRTLGGQGSSGGIESLIEILETCDLLIDCTAEITAFEILSAVSSFAKRTVVWGEVFAGGIGGLIARSRPSREPNSSSIRRTIEAWCAERGTAISRAPAPYEGGEDTPAVANDAEVSIIASHVAALSIDTLLGREPSAYPNAAYLIGLRAGWIFTQAFETYPVEVGPPEESTAVEVDTEEMKAEILEIVKLLKEHPGATPPQS
jgi:molybdopterin/thiamine biosynthesis adenylyltransferase